MAQKIHFRFSRDFKRNLWKTPKYEESFGEVSRFALLSQKNGFVFVDQLLHFWALPWPFTLYYGRLWCEEKLFGKFQSLPCFTRKMVLYYICQFPALNQCSMAQKIHFRFSRDFKRNLWKTPKYEESFGEVSRFALLSQKNGFVFVDQLLHFWALPWPFTLYYGRLWCEEKLFGKFQSLPCFTRKMFWICWLNLSISSVESIFNGPEDSI